MGKKRILLLTGGTGLLALNWACAMRDEWQVVLGVHRHRANLVGTISYHLNLEDELCLEKQVNELTPNLIVHTAGLTNVDHCEKDPNLAQHINVQIARNIAQVAARNRIRLIHISTDHLFRGDSQLYGEEVEPQPLNEYARSKLCAERWVQEIHANALIIRTNFFGWGYSQRQSFSDWLIYNLRNKNSLSLFDDVYFTPILADSLAKAAHQLIEQGAAGLFNVVGDQRISKYEFALLLAKKFSLSVDLIKRDQIGHANLQAPRPKDMSLDNTKVRQALGRNLGTPADYLSDLHDQEVAGRRDELFSTVIPVEPGP